MGQFVVLLLLFCSVSVWSDPIDEKKPTKRKSVITEKPEKKDFMPSLSDTLNDTNRLKGKIKRQLAKELSVYSKTDPEGRVLRENAKADSMDEIARFGDFSVGISERGEEELEGVKEEE